MKIKSQPFNLLRGTDESFSSFDRKISTNYNND